jgi:phospholipid/cholesterol/gamma-HCH transport system substrate-binding protein
MSKSRLEWKVGLFMFIGLVALAALLLEFSKGINIFRPTKIILLRAPNVGGLKIRAQVLMAGVQVGTVSDVRLGPQGTNVTISLKIYSQYEIHKDARFALETSGFLGDQYVAIIPTKNQGPVFPDQGVAEAEAPFNIQEVARSAGSFLGRIEETANRLNDAIADVRRFALNEQTLTNLSVAVGNLRTVSEHAISAVDGLNSLVTSNAPALSTSGSNLVLFSQQLNHFGDDLGQVLATNAPTLNAAVKNIESSTIMLKDLLADVQAGKGLAGNLLQNPELSTNVSLIVSNLSITSSNLNRLGVWGILWQHKPPKKSADKSIRTPRGSRE